jgi:hypothetical protein
MSKYFQPNPTGRPKSSAWVKHLAAKYTEDAIRTLVELMNDTEQDGKTRAMCANALLDRAHGKPAQELNANVNVNESTAEDVQSRIAAIVASAVGDADSGPTGVSH